MTPPAANEVHLWLLDLDRHADARDAAVLDDAERARAARLRSDLHGGRVITHRAWLRRVLGAYLDAPPATLRFATVANGKPVLDTCHGAHRPHFNLSHSGAFALLAVAHAAPLGVDLEAPRRVHQPLAVARRHFGSEEYAWVAAGGEQLAARFFTCWTRKEAFIKATGEGLARGLDSFDVRPSEAGPVAVQERAGDGASWYVLDLAAGTDLVAALCTRMAAPCVLWPALPAGCDAAFRR